MRKGCGEKKGSLEIETTEKKRRREEAGVLTRAFVWDVLLVIPPSSLCNRLYQCINVSKLSRTSPFLMQGYPHLGRRSGQSQRGVRCHNQRKRKKKLHHLRSTFTIQNVNPEAMGPAMAFGKEVGQNATCDPQFDE
jgi:hypothetical protein